MTGFAPLAVLPLATLEAEAAPPVVPDFFAASPPPPPRARPVAAAILASGFAWSGFTPAPPPETITADKWLPVQTRPAPEPPRPRGATGFTALAPDFVTADRWLGQPARPPRQASAPRSAHATPAELTAINGWRAPQAKPAFPVATPRAAAAWTAFVEPAEVITPDKWLGPVLSPVSVAYLPRSNTTWVPIVEQVEDITADKWLPAHMRPDYRAHFIGRQTVADPPWDTSPGVDEGQEFLGAVKVYAQRKKRYKKRREEDLAIVAAKLAALVIAKQPIPTTVEPKPIPKRVIQTAVREEVDSIATEIAVADLKARLAELTRMVETRIREMEDDDDEDLLLMLAT